MRPRLEIYLVSFLLVSIFGLARGDSSPADSYPSRLLAHATLPAETYLQLPSDLPESLRISGKYLGPTPRRNDVIGSFLTFEGSKFPAPFRGQLLAGISGIVQMGKNEFLVAPDSGFASKNKSVDYLLGLHRIRVDWRRKKVVLRESHFLHDPDRILPFHLVNEGSRMRYLTGGDLDPESMQVVGESVFIGDEFGPYLVRTDLKGKVTGFWGTVVNGREIKSPDHHALATPRQPGQELQADIGRSKGLEGMALSSDGKYLYPLLEGPLWDRPKKKFEAKQGQPVLFILEFDVRAEKFTSRIRRYLLEKEGLKIGDFQLLDKRYGLVIERDGKYGESKYKCMAGRKGKSCIEHPATFKRVYKVDLAKTDKKGFVRKRGFIDLLHISDPQGIAVRGSENGVFNLALDSIEAILPLSGNRILVANDNNIPDPRGRTPQTIADHEFVILQATELLRP